MANIWWAYDENNGSFSALPASPVLLPAIGLFLLLAAFDKMNSGPKVIGKTDALTKYPELFEANKTRFHELLVIMKRRPLTSDETAELYKIQHPPWADPGEVWTY
ncbi:MAG: hypothetical protein ACO3S3_12115 [Pseudohongiellaceae bacterium]